MKSGIKDFGKELKPKQLGLRTEKGVEAALYASQHNLT